MPDPLLPDRGERARRAMRGISALAPEVTPHPASGHPLPRERERRVSFCAGKALETP